MKCETLRENYEAFALGVLEPDQARQIEAHIRDCADCAQAVRAYQTAVDHLALAVPLYRAPPRLKQRIMGGVGAFGPTAFVPPFLRTRWWAASAAAVLLAFAVGGLAWAIILSAEVGRLRQDNSHLAELTQLDAEQRTALLRLQGDLNSARNEQRRMSTTLDEQATLIVLALDPDLVPTELQGTAIAPQSRCNYVWSRTQSIGALTCKNLATTPFAMTYELWATKGDKTVPLGTFLPRIDGTAQMLVKFPSDVEGAVTNLWVTLEQQNATGAKPSNDVALQRAPAQEAVR